MPRFVAREPLQARVSHRGRWASLLAIVATTAIACAVDDGASRTPTRPKSGTQAGAGTPVPGGTGQPGSADPTASATASPSPKGTGAVDGDVENKGVGAPTVRHVMLDPATFSLNAPPASGTKPAGFASSRVFFARVILTNGKIDDSGVTWSVSDAARLAVDAAGQVQVKTGAQPGAVAVYATSKGKPETRGEATVHVTTDGILRLAVAPPLEFGDRLSVQTTLNVTQGGKFILNRQIGESVDIRLPAGSSYSVQVQRTTDPFGFSDATADASASQTPRPPLIADVADLVIAPNAVTEATATLPTPAPTPTASPGG